MENSPAGSGKLNVNTIIDWMRKSYQIYDLNAGRHFDEMEVASLRNDSVVEL